LAIIHKQYDIANKCDGLFLHQIINTMSELKKAVNTVTGITRELGPNIYNNRFRMKSGNWQLIETPDPIDTDMIPVMANVPGNIKPQYEIPADTIPVDEFIGANTTTVISDEIPSISVTPSKPTANKPKSKNK